MAILHAHSQLFQGEVLHGLSQKACVNAFSKFLTVVHTHSQTPPNMKKNILDSAQSFFI
jgi:hypothetical protein